MLFLSSIHCIPPKSGGPKGRRQQALIFKYFTRWILFVN
ncbi:hypothetical protein CLOBOL_02434 [Enterocloster bolteae ATCC BAA-613]|uniref:Uncharacterized protein n=1 Tax=Enterocloster bolteae (strain ATCC BAA-613 / DSM 15670 / CCUG 46953 / JCM 12243 / WAL 16351) TaxID=411902 RepID=A8RPC9_ENTBW|nr:hypothetical protein CLOBOL_02434 [Enterocloster bolteae ATCC BAA-613]